MDLTPSPLRAITRISTASSWVNIDGTAKPVILAQVGQHYFGAVGQYYFGGNMQAWCLAADDVLDAVGDTSGVISRCKVGDYVLTMGPDSAAPGASVVVEAKASGVCTLKATLEEADLARRNRASSVCLFVHSAPTAPAGLPELHRWGHDIVVVWDAEDPATDVRLKAGLLLAKALCLRANQHEEEEAASLSEMDVAIEAIRKQVAGFEEIKTSANTIVGGGEKILKRARLMEEEIGRRLLALSSHMDRLRATTSETEG